MSENLIISVVVPVYKEADMILPFLKRLEPVLEKIGRYEILFCLDPSPDNTEIILQKEIERNPSIKLLVFSRRFGQPAAVMAGIFNCRGKYCVVIDVDLQDPPELITKMYDKVQEGYDVIYAKRRLRKGETFLKRFISFVGYKIINHTAHVNIPANTGDFRILSRRVIDELTQLSEKHGFLRGLVALIGFPQAYIEYDRDPRFAGKGKYNRLTGSLKIAFNGLVGFSSYPLSITLWLGCLIALLSAVWIIYILINKLIWHANYPLGVPTVIVAVLFMGGVQLASIGVLGEYISRIYDETRNRPLYIVDKAFNIQLLNRRGMPTS